MAQSHPRVTQSPSPEARTTAGALALARAPLGRVIPGNGKCRRASGRERSHPIKGLGRRAGSLPIMRRGGRRRTRRRCRNEGPDGWGRGAGRFPMRPTGQNCVVFLYGETILLQKAADRLGCAQRLWPIHVMVTHGE